MYLLIQIENFRLFAALRASSGKSNSHLVASKLSSGDTLNGAIPLDKTTSAVRVGAAAGQSCGPVVLADKEGRVAELNSAAQARQVLPGMTMARALSRCSEIEVIHLNRRAEAAAVRLLWNAAWQITPRIELGSGPALGSATLQLVRPDFEKLGAQVDQLIRRLRCSGLPARVGVASTPDWACLAASAAERFQCKLVPSEARMRELLAYLPLSALHCLSAQACRVLEGWGIRSLGAMAALPRQSLGERLGPVGLEAWDLVNGRRHRVLRFQNLDPDFREIFDLEDPVCGLEALSAFIHRAAEAIELQLKQAAKLARTVYLDLWLERGALHQKSIRLPEATDKADLLERLLRNYLDQIRLPGPVHKLQFAVEPVDPLSRQAGLFDRSVRNPWRLQETLDQLAGLLGNESFGTPRILETHRPDAYELVPLPVEVDLESLERAQASPPVGPPLMGPPLRRFRPPLAARVLLNEKRPVHIECGLISGAVRRFNGPYFLNGDWAGSEIWALCEWDVEIEDVGVYCLSRQAERWQLVGAYD